MKITYDIPRLQARPLGMQTYIEHVLRTIFEIAPQDWTFVARTMGLRGQSIHRERMRRVDVKNRAKNLHLPCPETIYQAAYEYGLDFWQGGLNSDLVHSFGSRPITNGKAKLIIAIQDVIPLRLNEGDSAFVAHSRKTLKKLTTQATKIITISEFSKAEISTLLEVDSNLFEVIPDGVDLHRYKVMPEEEMEQAEECLKQLGLQKPYILNVGGPAKRKNKTSLVEAFEILKKQFDVPHSLVLVGEDTLGEELNSKVQGSAYNDQIFNRGYLSPQQALWVLQQADVLVFPSTYEGFGLPPLEAMACGVPVALSNASSLPEVGADAAIYFNPRDPQEMAESTFRIINDAATKNTCIQKGLKRAQSLTWERNAQATIALYRTLTT